jgi:integration host factor subunit beta
VTKSELIAALAARYPQLAARDTDYAVKTMLDAMAQALAAGQRIEIRGFGSFSLSRRSPRIGRNPKSGEQVLVPGKQVPHFKAGKELRERVDLDGNGAAAEGGGDETRSSVPSDAATAPLGAHALL